MKPSNSVADVTFQSLQDFWTTHSYCTRIIFPSKVLGGKWIWWKILFWACECQGKFHPAWSLFFILSCFNPLSPLITMKWGFHFHTVVHGRFHLHPHCAWGPCTRGRMRSTDTLSPCCIDIYNPTQTPALSRHNCCTKIILCAEINPAYTCHVSAWRLSQWNHTYTGQRWNWYRITMSAQCLNQPTLQMHGLDQNTGG